MRIKIHGIDFNRIMKVCTPSLCGDPTRKPLQFIEVECNGDGEGCATALDGFTLAQTRFPYIGDAGKFMLFPCAKANEHDDVVITSDGDKTTVDFGDMSFTRTLPFASQYVNHSKITRDAQRKRKTITIAVKPALIAQMLKSHRNRHDPIYMTIYGADDAIVVHTDNSMGLLLPMRMSHERETPEFWEMNADGC